jgi:hypothetical protein
MSASESHFPKDFRSSETGWTRSAKALSIRTGRMPRLHPTLIVSSVALCALLACEHTIFDRRGMGEPVDDELVVEGKRAAEKPGQATGPAAAPPGKPSEAREALIPQPPPAPGGAAPAPNRAPPSPAPDAPAAASERIPTSGTAADDTAAKNTAAGDKAQDDAVAEAEGADRGSPSDTCVQGWVRPRAGSKLRKAALDMLREQRGERFVVIEMRYFVGPEDAEVIGPQRQVERWYVKARSLADRSRQQRWLLRRAAVGSGIDAVAPFDSTGYGPGTWRRPDAVDESTADPFQHPCDVARAGSRCMGLPRAVLGCLQGT